MNDSFISSSMRRGRIRSLLIGAVMSVRRGKRRSATSPERRRCNPSNITGGHRPGQPGVPLASSWNSAAYAASELPLEGGAGMACTSKPSGMTGCHSDSDEGLIRVNLAGKNGHGGCLSHVPENG